MSFTAIGDPFKGEVSSADASAGVAATLYRQGQTTALTLSATDRLNVTDLILISSAAVAVAYSIVFYPLATGVIADTPGLRIAKGTADILGGLAHHFETLVSGPVGYGVALIADAGQVNLTITGGVSKD